MFSFLLKVCAPLKLHGGPGPPRAPPRYATAHQALTLALKSGFVFLVDILTDVLTPWIVNDYLFGWGLVGQIYTYLYVVGPPLSPLQESALKNPNPEFPDPAQK